MAEEKVRDTLKRVVGLAKTGLEGFEDKIAQTLEQRNIEPNLHVGQPQDFFKKLDNEMEWLLGQMVATLNHTDESLRGSGLKHLVERAEKLLKGGK